MASQDSTRLKSNRVDDDQFERHKQLINQDIANTLQRVVNDYANHWEGVIGEAIQNSYDAWCANRFEREVISKDQDLDIKFNFDINSRTIRIQDNAGGMPSDVFYNKFTGLDTPGEEKLSGGAGGAYGRGFHVISGAGEETHAETKHDSFHGGLVVRGPYQMSKDELNDLSIQGTHIVVYDVEPDLILKLTHRDRVHEHIQGRFQKMLEHDHVSVEVTIDGETREVKPVDLSGFEVLWEGDIEFEHAGVSKTLKDAIVYRKGSEDIPFEGMSMNKRNHLMDRTFMRVKEYTPRQIKHLDKMFGFCDASVLCPKYENNAHTGWVGGVLPAGIKGIFEEIERKEFIGGPTNIEQRDEIVQTTLEKVAEQWGINPFDMSTEADDLDIGINDGERPTKDTDEGHQQLDNSDPDELPIDDPYDDQESEETELLIGGENNRKDALENTSEPKPALKCRTRNRRFDAGETVDVRVLVENPEGTGQREFEIGGEIEDEEGQIEQLEPMTITVAEGEMSGGNDGWEFNPKDREGKFVFTAELHPRGSIGDSETSNTYFYVGETIEIETASPRQTFIEDIEFIPDDDPKFRHELQEGDRALILLVNPSHAEYRYAEKLDGRNDTQHQIATLIRWLQEAIMNRLLLDRLEADLQNQTDSEGYPLDEKLTEFVREKMMNNLSGFSADTYESLT